MHVPEDLSASDERALVAAAEWLADHGRMAVWLAGAALRADDRVRAARILLSPRLRTVIAETTAPGATNRTAAPAGDSTPAGTAPELDYPALSGVPRSETERALEKALQQRDWAAGRHWNYRYERGPLSVVYRLDLYWPQEAVVVEVDGPDHRHPAKFAADRQRDNALTIDGLRILRFTNERVHTDIGAVLHHIEKLLTQRRTPGKRHHVGP